MHLHHLGVVGRDLETVRRLFANESLAEVTGPIEDPVQRVVVQFFRDRRLGDLWETIVPLHDVESSPLASRLRRGGGLDHACYELDAHDGTIEDVIEAERAEGSTIVCPPVHAVAFSRRIAFVYRQSGRLIEYVEARAAHQIV
ncbi:MAG: methylmalonyl-CoA epimerase [Gemmatimonadota bacterium]